MPVLKQKDEEEDIFVNNINYVGIFDMGDEEFTIGKENTVEVPGTGDMSTLIYLLVQLNTGADL